MPQPLPDTNLLDRDFVPTPVGEAWITPTGQTQRKLRDVLASPARIGTNIVFASAYLTLNAAFAALTAGDMLVLDETTYTLTTGISSSLANLHIWAPSWSTVVKRGSSLTGTMLAFTGAGVTIEGMTIDGNSVVNVTGSELSMAGANGLVKRVNVVNSASQINVALVAAGCRITESKITGLGTSLSTERGYGVWAVGHVKVMIDHNIITATGIDGIGFDGDGSIVENNQVSGCHCYTGGAGGQIVSYGGGSNTTVGAIIANNTVGAGGGNASVGIEVGGSDMEIDGNTVVNQQVYGILLSAACARNSVTNNTVLNSGQNGTPIDGISVQAGSSGHNISGNTCRDTQGSPTQRYGVRVESGASDNYQIINNILTPNLTGPLFEAGTGVNKVIANNLGVSNAVGTIASAATIQLLNNPIISLTGSATVTALSGLGVWTGRVGKFIPTGAVVFTAGAQIGNTTTCVANTPIDFSFDGTKLWLG